MLISILYPYIKLSLGTLYPCYKTWKALKRKDETTRIAALACLVLGTKLVFDSIVNRELTKREKAIDRWLTKIGKVRNELVALAWSEMSGCSVKILTASMSILLRTNFSDNNQASMMEGGKKPTHKDNEDDQAMVAMNEEIDQGMDE